MTTKIVWRLANRPTPTEVQDLFTTGLITKEEAREILFNQETDEDRDKKSLQTEIEFLRKVVQNLSTKKTTIYETIYEVQKPYLHQPWYQPYAVWCSNLQGLIGTRTDTISGGSQVQTTLGTLSGGTSNAVFAYNSSSNQTGPRNSTSNTGAAGFTEIKTF